MRYEAVRVSLGRRFAALQIFMLSWLQGASLGHRIFGIRVIRYVDGGPINARQAFIRSALLVTVVFAITFDEEGRGLHERFSKTILIRS
ncbi:MAG: RDD family protein [Streptomycetaceae bacterium]|nr:RDD family protein [Streptomycetaceae bacterium]